jgi:hypothetical protein
VTHICFRIISVVFHRKREIPEIIFILLKNQKK